MEKRRQSEVIKERAVRHNRLMKLIKSYTRSEEETRKLERIKMNTMMEINIRYLRSEHNRHYRFPKRTDPDDDDEDDDPADDPLARRENITYDLMTQNHLSPARALSHKVLSLDSSRKVTSLEIERTHWQRDRILRLNLKGKQHSSKAISRKNSLSDKRREGSRLKLPELKTEKGRENLKTEPKAEEEREIQSVIGKKLATESSESTGKMRGVEKYLRTIEGRQKENELKSNFKRKLFLPDKVS